MVPILHRMESITAKTQTLTFVSFVIVRIHAFIGFGAAVSLTLVDNMLRLICGTIFLICQNVSLAMAGLFVPLRFMNGVNIWFPFCLLACLPGL